MHWKNLPYWLKGAIIFFVLSFIFIPSFGLLLYLFAALSNDPTGSSDQLLQSIVSITFMKCVDVSCSPTFLSFIVIPVTFIIIGAVVGSIYEKLKQK